jgi:hypothetical protein
VTAMHLTDDELVLHYYGEMSDPAEARACAHLDECAACRENLQRLQRVMAAIDSAPVPEPDAFFEQRTWARLQGTIAQSPRRRAWALPWRAIAWGAAAALVVIAAFVAGQFTSRPSAPVQTAASQEPVHERVLLVDLGDHLDRTETALVEFVSGTDGRDVASARARVQDLDTHGLLFKVRVMREQLQERARQPVNPQRQETTL